ncbi:glutathione S-transferase Mu 3-like [Arapaima gigas]
MSTAIGWQTPQASTRLKVESRRHVASSSCRVRCLYCRERRRYGAEVGLLGRPRGLELETHTPNAAELKQKPWLRPTEIAQPIRLLLEYTGTPYEEKLYSCGEDKKFVGAPDYDKSCWLNEKEKLGMDFPNLPYLVDGDRKLVQSIAIMRYIARKHNLCGETEDEIIRVDIAENQAIDWRYEFVVMGYTDFDKLKPAYLQKLPGLLKQFSNFLGDRKWFAGDKITFVDFIIYELLDQNRMFEPTCLDTFKNLKDFLDRFEGLEKIAAYMKSDRFKKTPVNSKMAKWGNKKE